MFFFKTTSEPVSVFPLFLLR